MKSRANQAVDRSAQTELEALLDKLVAAQLDLDSIRQDKSHGASDPQHESVATAYGLLRSAIADLREIIQSVDGPPSR